MEKKFLRLMLTGWAVLAVQFSWAQLNLTAVGSPATIDFTGFTGAGFQPTPGAGELDSDTWSVLGLSDGDLAFGATGTTGDYARGTTTGGIATGGIYALDNGGNEALWIQPGGSDFTPGSLVLALENNTGNVLTGLDVSYDVLYLNDQDRGNGLALGYSSSPGLTPAPTAVITSGFITPETADATPTIQTEGRTVNISGITIAPGASFYLFWQGDDVLGGGSRDEYGLDNISVTPLAGPAGPSVSFAVEADLVREEQGTYLVTVNSTTTGAHTVDISVRALGTTATAGADYSAIGTVTASFATSTTFTFPLTILDDADDEPTEGITLELSNPTGGASIITPNLTVLSILDNDISGPALKPGDLVFYGYDNQFGGSGATDFVVLTNLVEIQPGTEFLYVNATYETGGSPNANQRTGRWYVCDDTDFADPIVALRIQYSPTAPNVIPAGSFICLELPFTPPLTLSVTPNGGPAIPASDFNTSIVNAANLATGSIADVNISVSNPDAVFLAQGDFAYTPAEGGYNGFSGTLLGGIQEGGTWYDLADDLSGVSGAGLRISRIPEELRCFAIQGSTTPVPSRFVFDFSRLAALYPAGPPYTQREVLGAIIDFTSNWITAPTPFTCPTSTLPISPGTFAGNWIGDVDDNWFNCQNWGNFQVPDQETNVVIGPTAIGDCEIDHSAPFADQYGRVARSNDLTISAPSGTATLFLQSDVADSLFVGGDLTIANNAFFNMDPVGGAGVAGILVLQGNWADDNTAADGFEEGNASTVWFSGTTPQTIAGNFPEGFANLVFNNLAGLILNSDVEVSESLTLADGLVNANANQLTILNSIPSSLAPGLSGNFENSYVYGGTLTRAVQASSNYEFPVGSNLDLQLVNFVSDATFDLAGGDDAVSMSFDDAIGTPSYNNNLDPDNGSLYADLLDGGVWDITASDAVDMGSYQVELFLRGSTNTLPGGDYRVMKATGGGPFELEGSFVASAQNSLTLTAEASQSGFTTFSLFGIGQSIGGAFPVELLSFTGTREGRAVRLDWSTATEQSSSHYLVARSQDGQTFEPLGRVEAAGFAQEETRYQLRDPQPSVGANHYRLQQVDLDGSLHNLGTVTVQVGAEAQLSLQRVYPNPTEGTLQVGFDLPQSQLVRLRVFNAQGQVVWQQQRDADLGPNEWTLHLEELAQGLYFFELQANGQAARGSFQKQ